MTSPLHLVPKSRMSGAIPPLHRVCFCGVHMDTFTFTFTFYRVIQVSVWCILRVHLLSRKVSMKNVYSCFPLNLSHSKFTVTWPVAYSSGFQRCSTIWAGAFHHRYRLPTVHRKINLTHVIFFSYIFFSPTPLRSLTFRLCQLCIVFSASNIIFVAIYGTRNQIYLFDTSHPVVLYINGIFK